MNPSQPHNSSRSQPYGTQTLQDLTYTCADCGLDSKIASKGPVRCRECGHRIMYKKRTRRMVQCEAR